MIVFKLGGSLLASGWLLPCLDTIAQNRHKQGGVIVPGGGVLADKVRRLQSDWRFDDRTAHAMAILSMQQMALLLHGLRPAFKLARRIADIRANDTTGAISLWSPDQAELDADDIPASWDITSDSLSAWLANKLSADELILIKAAAIDRMWSIGKLASDKIVDAGLSQYTEESGFLTRVVNVKDFINGNRENGSK
jgi:5-(aminomethyl)-3-furanmethanol phosphate kinase